MLLHSILLFSVTFGASRKKAGLDLFAGLSTEQTIAKLGELFGEEEPEEPVEIPKPPAPKPKPSPPSPPPAPEPPVIIQRPDPVPQRPQQVPRPAPSAPQIVNEVPIQIEPESPEPQQPSAPEQPVQVTTEPPKEQDTLATVESPAETTRVTFPNTSASLPNSNVDTNTAEASSSTETSNSAASTIWTVVAIGGVICVAIAGYIVHRSRTRSKLLKELPLTNEKESQSSATAMLFLNGKKSRASTVPRNMGRNSTTSPLRNEITASSTMPHPNHVYETISLQTVVSATVANSQISEQDRAALFGRNSQIEAVQEFMPFEHKSSPILEEMEPVYIGLDMGEDISTTKSEDFIVQSIRDIENAIDSLGAPQYANPPVVKNLVSHWEEKYNERSPADALKEMIDSEE